MRKFCILCALVVFSLTFSSVTLYASPTRPVEVVQIGHFFGGHHDRDHHGDRDGRWWHRDRGHHGDKGHHGDGGHHKDGGHHRGHGGH